MINRMWHGWRLFGISQLQNIEQGVSFGLQRFQTEMIQAPKDKHLKLTIQTFKHLAGFRLGIAAQRKDFDEYLDLVFILLNGIMKEVQDDMHPMYAKNVLPQLFTVYQHVFDFQLTKWKAIPRLITWLMQPKVQRLFYTSGQPLLLLQFINLIHQSGITVDPFEKSIEGLIAFLIKQQLTLKERVDLYYGVQIIGGFEESQRRSLKESLRQFSQLRDQGATLSENASLIDISGEYIHLASHVFYQPIIEGVLSRLSGSDAEQQILSDPETDDYLYRIFELVLTHIPMMNNRIRLRFSEFDHDEQYATALRWRSARNMAVGLVVLSAQNLLTDAMHRRFETEISNALYLDTAHIRYGIEICNILSRFPDYTKGTISQLISSIGEQIITQPFDELEIHASNVASILYNLVHLDRYLEGSAHFIRPAVGKIYEAINKGYFDADMKKVDWYEIQQLAEEMQMEEIQEHVNKMIQQ